MIDDRETIEYNDPTIPDGDDEVGRYIETRPGQKFGVKIILLPGFEVIFDSGVRWIIQKDDEDFTQKQLLRHQRISARQWHLERCKRRHNEWHGVQERENRSMGIFRVGFRRSRDE